MHNKRKMQIMRFLKSVTYEETGAIRYKDILTFFALLPNVVHSSESDLLISEADFVKTEFWFEKAEKS